MTEKRCPVCGLEDRHRKLTPSFPLGRTMIGDLQHASVRVTDRARAGDRLALNVARVVDALILALIRDDGRALESLGGPAVQLLRTQKPNERWRHDTAALLDNATIIRGLIARVQAALDDFPSGTEARAFAVNVAMQNAVSAAFPGLPGSHRSAANDAAGRDIEGDALRTDAEAAWLAERALVHYGMPAREAHQRFAFVRMAAHRDAKRPERKRRNRKGRV